MGEMMRTARLISSPSTDNGTFGSITLDDGTNFVTGELPWKDNAHGISCIPAGTYTCRWRFSPKHGECYEVMDVPNRDKIEIHSANFVGDASKGKLSQLQGCIALGKYSGILEGQLAVLASKQAIAEFEKNMAKADFELTIVRTE